MANKQRYRKAAFRDVIGSGFAGYLQASFDDILKEFGEPHWRYKEGPWFAGDQKVRAEWAFKIGCGKERLVFTIYDYKDPRPVETVDWWHIGCKGDASRLEEIFSGRVRIAKRRQGLL